MYPSISCLMLLPFMTTPTPSYWHVVPQLLAITSMLSIPTILPFKEYYAYRIISF